jgi:hypothetical protein
MVWLVGGGVSELIGVKIMRSRSRIVFMKLGVIVNVVVIMV